MNASRFAPRLLQQLSGLGRVPARWAIPALGRQSAVIAAFPSRRVVFSQSVYGYESIRGYASKKGGKGKKGGSRTEADEASSNTAEREEFDLKDIEQHMANRIEHLKREFAMLRVGRANPRLLDTVPVLVDGERMPLISLARVSTKDPLTLLVSAHDPDHLSQLDKAIRESGLGLNPQINRGMLMVPVPPMTKELREKSIKEAGRMAELTRSAVRAIRQTGMKQAKATSASKDDQHKNGKHVQNLTKQFIQEIDSLLKSKSQDISQS